MARFDFVEAVSQSYKYIWDQRAILLRLAAIPALIKVVFFTGIVAFQMEESFLRQGLIMLPVYFVEAWLVVNVLQMAMIASGWRGIGGYSRKNEARSLQNRTITAAIVLYVLTKLVMSFMAGFFLTLIQTDASGVEAHEPNVLLFTGFMLMLIFMFWAFRLLWLYVPVVMDIPLRLFLKRIKGYMASFYMLATWMLCFMPAAVVLLILSGMVESLFPTPEGADPSSVYLYIMAAVQAVVEIIMILLGSVAMAFGIQDLFDDSRDRDEPTLF